MSRVNGEAWLTIVVTVNNLECIRVLLQGAVEQHAILRQMLKGFHRDDAVACSGGRCSEVLWGP